ncbi:unnamed protein product [Lupinus luteus]|uniref:LysR family transcriptional regulator n=1 Tax=Lupinus luteus TaxID=3873 RepID=A0AAV1XSB2_LUPLU
MENRSCRVVTFEELVKFKAFLVVLKHNVAVSKIEMEAASSLILLSENTM